MKNFYTTLVWPKNVIILFSVKSSPAHLQVCTCPPNHPTKLRLLTLVVDQLALCQDFLELLFSDSFCKSSAIMKSYGALKIYMIQN